MGSDASPGEHPTVLISDRQSRALDLEDLATLARRTLRAEGVEVGELSLSSVEEDEIADLHLRYLDEPGSTDVLSFPQDGDAGDGAPLLGDVVIAPAVAERNHPEDPPAEVRLLLVHGILHLLGYDHEEDEERAEMWLRQERYSGVRAP